MSAEDRGRLLAGYIVPNQPQVLHDAFGRVRTEIQNSGADLLVLFSTRWVSIIGHQVQADPEPKWWAVDEDFHELGSLHYHLKIDASFGELYVQAARLRGLHARTVAYQGFPIDAGSITALRLLNPDNALPASIVSCNMYSDRAETLVLGKAARDAVEQSGRRAIAVAVTSLSNRMFTEWIDPAEDRIHSQKDDEWNRKLLELLAQGRLEDVSQLAREFTRQANGDSRLKAIWWLAAILGQNNDYAGQVFDYQPVWGTGSALVGLEPVAAARANLEYDEDDADSFTGDRSVLSKREPKP